ncbi:MAG: fatty acid desaturase [Piscirickettsiaceae bacterium CG_4_9_14_3_um_filter_43_564]|nr:fatty acid desaturase [Thiomicrospira sp.]OIP96449.1 MAG: fatty acid desaturase [Thiomicrospira sp. CG2_30_44_34]PIQ02636.1 MAG: fatty acid desaturase [Piscirickettsiaceae bacterium CG18_big_fil_WC_8_21_14_2_50_44_103]PIU38624.1 MAG: fatty acid desaturase [Piscirickettsiaceae bacterium CG07_land_8_20_14_0_80_44_28]PIW57534.1 MAG: fatty acid desaturase [Piscirickettsiaceae bacterium CG12_big_fil_rev_8_21_14_0_65_44_934]PIW77527.1 MAG: fatty acid desaturase [Piscirickettsiaceae bacterium CG_4
MKSPTLLRYDDAVLPNSLAFSYMILSYLAGFGLMLLEPLIWNGLGVLLLAHAMVISAYMLHEAAHHSLFRKPKHNRWLGEVCLWITGCSYSHFDDVQHKHNRHHIDRADIVSFDFRETLPKHPLLLKVIKALEWVYIPALEVWMHLMVIVLPFIKPSRKQRRGRVVLALIFRVAFFAVLVSISWHVLWLYALAYLLFLTVMRFMDIHQHTYEVFETLDQPRGPEAKLRNADFEQRNTYSNLLSVRYPWLNLLVLNFCYHNVHHASMLQPWYRLPKLNAEMFDTDHPQQLTFKHLVKSFHRYRVPRILNGDPVNLDVKQDEGESFIGVDGVSFLTAH